MSFEAKLAHTLGCVVTHILEYLIQSEAIDTLKKHKR